MCTVWAVLFLSFRRECLVLLAETIALRKFKSKWVLLYFMPKILFESRIYQLSDFADEAELERTVVKFSESIFGENTVYFDIKKKVRT